MSKDPVFCLVPHKLHEVAFDDMNHQHPIEGSLDLLHLSAPENQELSPTRII